MEGQKLGGSYLRGDIGLDPATEIFNYATRNDIPTRDQILRIKISTTTLVFHRKNRAIAFACPSE